MQGIGEAQQRALILPLTCVAGTQLNIEADVQHLASSWGATSAASASGCSTWSTCSCCHGSCTGAGTRSSSSCSTLLRPLLLLPLRLPWRRRGSPLHCRWPLVLWRIILVQDVLTPHLPSDAPRRGAACRRCVHGILHALHLLPAPCGSATMLAGAAGGQRSRSKLAKWLAMHLLLSPLNPHYHPQYVQHVAPT